MTGSKYGDGYARSGRFDSADGKSSIYAIEGRGSNPGHGLLREEFNQRVEIALDQLRRDGKWSPGAEVAVRARAAMRRDEEERKLRMLGVPPHLKRLLEAPTKREAEKIARDIVLNDTDFGLLTFNAHTHLGFHHWLEVREFRPEHHAAMFEDVAEAMEAAEAGSASAEKVAEAARKTDALFRERKRVAFHIFRRGAKWHVFFFDFSDMSDGKIGLHVHYLSHRWADVTLDDVMAAMEQRRQSLPRSVHVRYERSPSDAPGRRLLVSTATGGIYRTVPDSMEPGDNKR